MENKRTNTLAIVGFIISIILGIPGLIVSIVALLQIKKRGDNGKGFAIAGIIIGIINTIIIVLSLISVIFSTLIWSGVKDGVINSVYCSNAFDCTIKDGKKVCYYCEDGNDFCTSPKQITCPIDQSEE